MEPFIIDARIQNNNLEISNLPFDNASVKVIVIPKIDLSKMTFLKARSLTEGITTNISDDIFSEREER